jgi:hypothetical protein
VNVSSYDKKTGVPAVFYIQKYHAAREAFAPLERRVILPDSEGWDFGTSIVACPKWWRAVKSPGMPV